MDSYRRGVILTLRLNISSTLPDHNKNQGALQIWTIEAILLLVVVFILLGHFCANGPLDRRVAAN